MNQEILIGWIEALRSEKYQQNELGELRTSDDEFSVLGVLCDLYDSGGWKLINESDSSYYFMSGGSTIIPPKEVIDWLGHNPTLEMDGRTRSMVYASQYYSFKEVAEFLRVQYVD